MHLNKMKGWLWLPFCLSVFCHDVLAWGQTGHRVTGAIAERYLSEQAKAAVSKLLPNESLAEASTYADAMRSNPTKFWQKTSTSWHYVTVPAGQSYTEVGAPDNGDAITALDLFSKVLKDKYAKLEDKQLALRFIIHIIGDLHQPLHVGNGTDRGGSSFKVTFMHQETNLHSVWDTKIIAHKTLSYSEWTEWLESKITPQDAAKWAVTDPQIWMAESAQIRDKIYPKNRDLSWDYIYEQTPTVKHRLQQAGVRMAAYLNELLAESS